MKRLVPLAVAVAALHTAGWGLFVFYSRSNPSLAGLGMLAYSFGLRHAFDADHIAAIDNVTRRQRQQGKRPLGAGFFFSLGHSTVVFALVAGLAIATGPVGATIPGLRQYGGTLGAGVSGAFLWVIGVLNLIVLVDVVRMFRRLKRGRDDGGQLEQRLLQRGLMSRVAGRLVRCVDNSWKMYPLGLLFGLGFDTATEVGLLAIAASVATHQAPFLAVLSLPLLFAAGMALLDTADGAFMSHAYGWALASPVRRLHYNITVTSLSVTVALGVGSIELLQLATGGSIGLDLSSLGYVIGGLFALTWACSVAVWKGRRIEARWTQNANSPRASTTAEPPTSTRSMRSPSPSAVA